MPICLSLWGPLYQLPYRWDSKGALSVWADHTVVLYRLVQEVADHVTQEDAKTMATKATACRFGGRHRVLTISFPLIHSATVASCREVSAGRIYYGLVKTGPRPVIQHSARFGGT